MKIDSTFWRNKRVFITGHTGFKGSWLSLWLQSLGADVAGYALPSSTHPNLFTLANVAKKMTSILSDVCDAEALTKGLQKHEPSIVFHLAAQPLVRLSYEKPAETFSTNVMGTVNLLEAIRIQKSVKAVVIITTDKCYENREWLWGYRENEPLGGRDPYSSSKSCVELVSAAYRDSFFDETGVFLATARAGNVIGGGDWSQDRLIPDILRAMETKSKLIIRNPMATRPWQHVLDPLYGYLLLAENLLKKGEDFASAWNFGPLISDVQPVKWIIEHLSALYDTPITWEQTSERHPHEAHQLALDSTKAHTLLGWKASWNLERALLAVADWNKAWLQGKNMNEVTLEQIHSYSRTLEKQGTQSYAA